MSGLDINLFREEKGGNPEMVRQSCIKRNKDPKIVDLIIAKDKHWREVRFRLDQVKKEWNDFGKEITQRKIAKKDDPCTELLDKKAQNEWRQQ
jgi:seryl-tRNA synthetase